MKVGDAVRMYPAAADRVGHPEYSEIGLVVDTEAAWPQEPHSVDLRVFVSYPNGLERVWFDWQLEVVNESR